MGKKTKSLGCCAPDEDWQAESDLDCLMRAEEIRKDPKRLERAKAMATRKLEAAAKATAITGK